MYFKHFQFVYLEFRQKNYQTLFKFLTIDLKANTTLNINYTPSNYSFLNKTELERKNIYVKQKIYDESLYKEFVDINSEAVKNEEKENLIQKQQSNENLRNWMKGEGRMNKFEFMKYDFEINGIKTYKRKHNLKKVAIDIRKLN